MNSLTYNQTVTILAPVEKVWDALINPEVTPQYMFGCQVVSDWQINNPVIWRGVHNGIEYVKGKLVSFEPEKQLAYTVFDPNAGYIDDPSNYLTTTYQLTPDPAGTLMQVSQGDFATVENGEKRFKETAISWEMTLASLKRLLEN